MKYKTRSGDYVYIDMGGGKFCYARILKKLLVGFYDVMSDGILSVDDLSGVKFCFKINVTRSACEDGCWRVIGHEALSGGLLDYPRFYIKDIYTGQFSILNGIEQVPASKEDCKNLEEAAVWSWVHIKSRLIDHFNGDRNVWVSVIE